MACRMEGAELLNRLCDLRDAYKRRGPDDREASATMASLVDDLRARYAEQPCSRPTVHVTNRHTSSYTSWETPS